MPKIYIYVPGIDTFPGASDNWSGRAVTYTHTHTADQAEKVEYFCGPIDRAFGQWKRARKLARVISFYQAAHYDLVLAGHSNGTDVILKALELTDWPTVQTLHLFNGACNADFGINGNGLNGAIFSGQVGRVFVYVGGEDRALAWAHTLPGKMLGYGTLGLHGPQNVAPIVEKYVHLVEWPKFGHSEAWTDANFEHTMGYILRDE